MRKIVRHKPQKENAYVRGSIEQECRCKKCNGSRFRITSEVCDLVLWCDFCGQECGKVQLEE